jgi:diguanylate cyclase (GGDEF)-like protein
VPANEAERLAALAALELIGSRPEPEFDSLVALACLVFKAPIALVSLLDDSRQWFKARQGLDPDSTERDSAFCNYAVAAGDLFVVEDATKDARFAHNRLVTGPPHIRFYAGAPIAADPGLWLGTLCVIDTAPRRFSAAAAAQLRGMAGLVSALVRQHRDARAVARLGEEVQAQSRANRDHSDALTRYRRIFDHASTIAKLGAWERNAETGVFTCTDGISGIHELPRGAPISWRTIADSFSADFRERLRKAQADPAHGGGLFTIEGEITTAKGAAKWIRAVVDVERENGVVVRWVGMTQDITAEKTTLDRMRFLAECDRLTGLANRSVLQARLLEPRADADGPHAALALLLIDLDGFKHINDTFGHASGDECLQQVALRLVRVCEGAELVVRLGGDEFAVLLGGAPDRGAIETLVTEILARLRRPISWGAQSFQLSGSVGVAISQHDDEGSQLFTEADLALYAAKAAGRNTFRIFTPELKRKADARFETIANIARALDEDQLELFYQPKISLADGLLSGFEALLRWRRSDGEIIVAGEFVAALEDPELSRRLGEWVVETAIDQAQAWRRAGLVFGHIAINLSPSQFNSPRFAERLIESILAHDLPTETIEIEVTEGVFLSEDKNVVRETLETLQLAGVRIALDDFGTGFASLTHLRTYPVDIIKIDRSFVQHLLTSLQDHAILQSILFLARKLRLDVIAEGIEDAQQCESLKTLGCRYGQGYLFSRAVPAAEAVKWCPPIAEERFRVA